MAPQIAFDEAGNTGQDLLNPEQPVFVSAGVRLSLHDIEELRDLLAWRQPEELKFSTLRRSAPGRRRLLRLFTSRFAAEDFAKSFAVHKPFMVTTKLLDDLMEPLLHARGIDFYARGANLATANLFQMVGPYYCGRERYEAGLHTYVEMIRAKSPETVRAFYSALEEAHQHCTDETIRSGLGVLRVSERFVGNLLEVAEITSLDPALPAFLAVAEAWDREVGGAWTILHDESKPIAFDQDIIESYLDDGSPRRVAGHGPFAVELPLRATHLELGNSAQSPTLQVADLFAGAIAHFFKGKAYQRFRDDLSEQLGDTGLTNTILSAIWPTDEVSPEGLGREEFDGSGLEAVSDMIGHKMRQRYGDDWFAARRVVRTQARERPAPGSARSS